MSGRRRSKKPARAKKSAPRNSVQSRNNRPSQPPVQHNLQVNQYRLGFPTEDMVSLRSGAPELYAAIIEGMQAEQKHRVQQDRETLEIRRQFFERGQYFSWTLGVMLFLSIGGAIYLDRQWIGGLLGAGAILVILRAVWGNVSPGNATENDSQGDSSDQ